MAPVLFEDTFEITMIDRDGKKFDKVSRIEGKSEMMDAYIVLDVNIDVYPINKDKRYTIVLASSLDPDGNPDTGYFNPTSRETLADKYDYVMHGKVYRFSDVEGEGKSEIYVSYGGLLMCLKVDKSTANPINLDQRLFLLMKKAD